MQIARHRRSVALDAIFWCRLLFAAGMWVASQCDASPLWIAGATQLVEIDSRNGQSIDQIEMAGIEHVAVAAGGGAWVIVGGNLSFVTPEHQIGARVDVVAAGYGRAALLATDPYNDSVWVVTSENLVAQFNTKGRLLGGYLLPLPASAVAVALDQTVWIAGDRVLWHLSPELQTIAPRPIDARWNEPVLSMVVDSLRDRLWVIGKRLYAAVDTLDANRPAVIVSADSGIRGAALDPKTGSLWLLTASELLDDAVAAGHPSKMSLRELGADDAHWLVYDGSTEALVLVSPDHVTVLDRARGIAASVQGQEPNAAAAATPFHLLPALSLVRPLDNASTFDRQPAFVLQLESRCNGIPCVLPPAYLETLKLMASVNGEPIAYPFQFDPATGRSTVAPLGPLPRGSSDFSAQAIDRFGHRSNAIESKLAVLDPFPGTSKANKVPTVNLAAPTNNATFVAGSNITVTATASDIDGTVARVDFYRDGATLLGTVTKAPYTIVWNNVAIGKHALTATATDNQGGTKTSPTVNITVTAPPNAAPTIQITNPVNAAVVNGPNVTINAIAKDSDGLVAKVDFYDGPTLLGTFSGGVAAVNAVWTYTIASAGVHTLKATAVDNAGAAASATVAITVNAAPYVVLIAPANCGTYDAPASLTLTADALDIDGSIARVDFYQGATLLGSVTGAPYSLAWPNVSIGTYSLSATAIDNRGASRSSIPVAISVLAPDLPPTVTLTAPIDAATFGVGAAIPVAATASDRDGTIRKVEFYAGSTLVGAATASPYTIVWTPTVAAGYTLTAKATDDRGIASVSAAVHVTVVANRPPTVTLTAPVSGAAFNAPGTVNLAANASDSDGTVAKVEFFANSILVGSATAAPYAASWSNVAGGTYSITAKATDNLGAITTSSSVSVTVNTPPRVYSTAPADNTSYAAPASFLCIGYASDADGGLTKMEPIVNGVVQSQCLPAPTPGHDYSCTLSFSGVKAGLYTFAWRATDALGATTLSAPIHVTVNSVPTVTLTTPADGSRFPLHSPISVGANVAETYGTVVKVEFYAGSALIGTATTTPYAIAWANASQGSYVLTAKATDNLGIASTSSPVTVFVDPIALNITSPIDGATTFESTAVVTGTVSGGMPTSITVNGQMAVLASSSYAATVPLQVGSNPLVVTANTSNGSATRSVTLTRSVPTMVITDPRPGQAISDDNVTVRGAVQAAPNSAIFINNKMATIDSNGTFFANNVPLAAGSNTLAISLNTSEATGSVHSFSLTSSGVAPFTVDVTPDTVIAAPATVDLTLKNRGLASYARLDVDLNGDGTVDYTENGPPAPVEQQEYTLTYSNPGTYPLTLTLLDALGKVVYRTTRLIHVSDATTYHGRLTDVYTGMLNRLRAGDTEGALRGVTAGVYQRYKDIFSALGSNLPGIIDRVGTITQVTFGFDLAEILVTRDTADGPQAFMIYLLRGEDGIWRIDGM